MPSLIPRPHEQCHWPRCHEPACAAVSTAEGCQFCGHHARRVSQNFTADHPTLTHLRALGLIRKNKAPR